MPFRGNMSWSWRKILQLRPLVRNFIWYKLGDGFKALAWFDLWCSLSPLANIVSSRDVHRAGFCPTTTVRDIITPNGWAWPSDWVQTTRTCDSNQHDAKSAQAESCSNQTIANH
ncbi:reverse transcriptase domain, Reverse transcriptase zinc-binding domain protein [Artemisia annua]|uniref:Reverse transcriptase domain, Reverse transcriptase zinc-binding domain protein n=1 Tax=Artemisia annua TaxID=35608 RepID=A0A2U1L0V8_ARTAN|nr:reverse transcriptase domain, Reverse transcriptase zinc-binding domain protein [Artemisia annua]